MQLPDLKALKKLADACRKAGIKEFKSPEFSFTLTDDAPVSNYKRRDAFVSKNESPQVQGAFESDTLSEEALLMWSSGIDLDPTNTGDL